MSGFVESFRNIFKIEELRNRILFTLALLVVVRIGAHITLPGIDAGLLSEAQKNQADNTLFGLYDLFVGGAFQNAAIFALRRGKEEDQSAYEVVYHTCGSASGMGSQRSA